MAKILLNEGTEIEVKETRTEIKELIKNKFFHEKINKIIDHFIEVTIIMKFIRKEDGEKNTKEVLTDLYYKRILYIYD